MYVPPRVEVATDLSERIERSVQWIEGRTGVLQRHIADEDESMATMAATAGAEALDGERPDLIINASLTPIQLIPDSSVFVQKELGFEGIPSFSVHATCMSFAVGLHTAGALVTAGAYRRVLVVSSEQGSVCRDFEHPESAALIGDGAAAAVIEPTPTGESSELLSWAMSTWPEGSDLAELRGCGTRRHPNDPRTEPGDNLFRMRGPRIYKMAVTKVDELVEALLDQANMTRDAIDWVVPHQPSGPGLGAVSSRFGFAEDRVVNIISEYGNCIAASIPMALHTAIASGRLQRGQTFMLLGTGAGLSVAGAILRY